MHGMHPSDKITCCWFYAGCGFLIGCIPRINLHIVGLLGVVASRSISTLYVPLHDKAASPKFTGYGKAPESRGMKPVPF
jgi:hypothetical protein